jgi:central glycolytic genes regulator
LEQGGKRVQELIRIQQKIAPEVTGIIQQRYDILRTILYNQPIGRRSLAVKLRLGERIIRGEVDFLQELNLLRINQWGMTLTEEGEELLSSLEQYIRQLGDLSSLEQAISKALKLPQVVIVPGDASVNPMVKKDLGRATARYLKEFLQPGQIMAVTGGTTLAEVAEALENMRFKIKVQVVPARGGLGEQVGIQANTIAARIADHLEGEYRLLHVPDYLSPAALKTLQREAGIREILDLIASSDLVVHGIGTVSEMAARRGFEETKIKKVIDKGAVGEALGYYINSEGKIVDVINSVGLHLKDLKKSKLVVAVAGGKNKAAAILACMYASPQSILITDQGAAEEMMRLMEEDRK